MRFGDLPLPAQTAYAELAEQTGEFETSHALAGLTGSFQKLARKGQSYWYFAYRDFDGKLRMSHVGSDDERVTALVAGFRGNLLGVKWSQGSANLDGDFAHAGENVSVALPGDLRIDVHGALA